MRVPTSDALNQFLLANSHYPFNCLQPTRSSFFCKWIMLAGRSPIGLTYYFPVFANSIPNRQLLEMICSGEAKPMPPKLSHVMDNMYWWGKSRNNHWYEQVVDSIGAFLDEKDVEEDQRELVRYLIAFEVKWMVQEHFDVMSVPFNVVFDQWFVKFNLTYKKADFDVNSAHTFRSMAEYSFDYVEWLVDETKEQIDAVTVDPVMSYW
jgi:hypothetical protein